MRRVRRLDKIGLAVERKVHRLEGLYRARSVLAYRPDRAMLAYGVVELDNLIVNANRHLAISMIWAAQRSGATNLTGVSVPIEPAEYEQLYRTKPIKPNEPPRNIRDPVEIRNMFLRKAIPISVDFSNAIALNYSVFSEIKEVRHYYAHRSLHTFRELQAHIPIVNRRLVRHADEIVTGIIPSRSTESFIEWLGEVRADRKSVV